MKPGEGVYLTESPGTISALPCCGSPTISSTTGSFSISVTTTEISNGVSSAVLVSEMAAMTGASFTGVIVIATVAVSDNSPSLTL